MIDDKAFTLIKYNFMGLFSLLTKPIPFSYQR